VDLQLRDVEKQLLTKGVQLEVTEAAKDWLGEKGYDPVFGARPLRRVIQNEIEDKLSEALLQERFATGDKIVIDAEDGKLVFNGVSEPALA
jgi:ATP-dependent Clp protease ATP-binding subunit ClpC